MCRQLLGLKKPWDVSRVQVDTQSRELHAYLGTGKKWFGRKAIERPECRWRHANIGEYKAFIHASLPEPSDGPDDNTQLAFLGSVESDFTHGLAQRVIECLRAGLGYRQVCSLLEIDVHLAWQIRHAVTHGQLTGEDHGTLFKLETDDEVNPAAQAIPPTGDPAWFRLLESERPIDVGLLGLKLLLARSRQEFPRLTTHDAKIIRVNAIRRFFIKHESQLSHEIEQLNDFRQHEQVQVS